MNNEFECLNGYSNDSDDPERQREKSVKAALVLLNTSIASISGDNPRAINDLSSCKSLSLIADKIQEALDKRE